MNCNKIKKKLRLHFPFQPTTQQDQIINDISEFVTTIGNRSIFMLKGYAGTGKKFASTIHRKIYWIRTNKSGNTFIKLKENLHTNTIFIVDEASMISEASDSGFGNRSLLHDLIKYVYEGIDCKLILIGDKAQLPPVNLDISPALNEEILFLNYNKQVISKELTEVVRQKRDSLILENATRIRKKISINDLIK